MMLFILGLIIFFVPHFYTTFARESRARLIARLGDGPYKGLYSLVSLIGFVLIIIGWRSASAEPLYTTPYFFRHISYFLMLIALVLIVAAYAPPGKIGHAVKHPMLAAVKIWAFAHLLVNGEIRSVILFGSFLAYAVIDRIAVKRRNTQTRPAGPVRNDIIALLIGLGVYLFILFYGHRYIAGVSLL